MVASGEVFNMGSSYKERLPGENMELLSSGTFITFGSGATAIEFELDDKQITLIFHFVNTGWPRRTKAVPEVAGEHTLRIVFRNYNNPSGIYTRKPVFVGRIAQRSVWITYRISSFRRSPSKMVTYSVYSAAP